MQGNDLAKAFGNLKAFEHKLLDYCFSYVTKESNVNGYLCGIYKRGLTPLWAECFRKEL